MKPFIPATNCAQVAVRGVQATKQQEFTLDVLFGAAYTLADLTSLATAVDNWVGAHLLALLSSSYTYAETYVRGLTASVDLATSVGTHTGPGANAGAPLSIQTAIVMTKATGNTGRSARGRLYVGGLAEVSLEDPAHIQADTQAGFDTAFESLRAALVGLPVTPVVVSKYHAGVARVAAVTFPIITIYCRDTRLDTQRRRLGKS